jgi:hypothetical protein
MDDPIQILQQVHTAIRQRDQSVLARGERWRPGGIFDLQEHFLHLIERALRTHPRRAIPLARLCDRCFYLTPTGFCPHRSRCVLHRHAVAQAIAIALDAE